MEKRTQVWNLCLYGGFKNQALLLSLEGPRSVQDYVTAFHGRQNGLQVVPVHDSVLQTLKGWPILHCSIVAFLPSSAQYDGQIWMRLDERCSCGGSYPAGSTYY